MEPDPKKGEEWILLFCQECGLAGCTGQCNTSQRYETPSVATGQVYETTSGATSVEFETTSVAASVEFETTVDECNTSQPYEATPSTSAAPSEPPPLQRCGSETIRRGGGGGRRRLFKDEGRAGTSFGRRSCPHCDKTFPSSAKLSHHLLSHTGERPFRCLTCPKSFSSKFKLMRHSLIHSNKRQYECAVCSRTFLRKDHLVNHTKVHYPAKVSFKCDRAGCTKEYSTQLSLRKHRAHHSAVEGDTQCKICNTSFQTKEEIFLHLKVHAGSRTLKGPADKKYQCERCGLRFFTRKDVRRHLVVHTGRRDFLCQYCPQRFGRKDHLVRHVNKSHNRASSPSVPQRTNRKQRSATDVVQEFVQSQSGATSSTTTPLPTFSQAFPPPPS